MEEVLPTDRFAETLATCANAIKSVFWVGEQKLMITLGYCKSREAQTTLDKIHGLLLNLPFVIYGINKLLGVTYPFYYGLGVLPLGVYFQVGGSVLLGISNLLHSREWTMWKGNGEVVAPSQLKIMHLNACMFSGSLPWHFGKQVPATERLNALGQKIEETQPHLLFLCEMGQEFSTSLYERIKEDYHLFVVNVGTMASGIDADLYFASKEEVLSVEFIPSKISRIGDQKWMNRGYLLIETKEVKYLYTHLHPKESKEAKEVRRRQIEEEILPMIKEGEKPWLLVGDLNIDRNKEEYRIITTHFTDHVDCTVTCQEGEETESVDYILTLKDKKKLKITKIQVDLDLNLSDHAAITAIVEVDKKTQ